jgi:hypothetical protein
MAEPRDPEVVRREIAVERHELARAVDRLRAETTSARSHIGARLKAVSAVLVGGLVLLATLPRIVRYAVRRSGR